MNITTYGRNACHAAANSPEITACELYKAEPNGHKFAVGEERTLTGLVEYPEFNGQKVIISAIREDGPRGKAYYIRGEINCFINWVYEDRLC